jgi:acetyl esterase/lipase
MSTVFFLLSILYAWMAWNLHHPNFHHQRWSFLSFAFGLPASELGLHVIFWQVVTVAFFVLIGAVSGLFGAIGFLLCTASWSMIAFYYYDSAKAAKEVTSGLEEGLGKRFRSQINEDLRQQFAEEPDAELIRHPFQHRDPEVELIRNVHFGDFDQKLDIRRPRTIEPDSAMPVLLHIHGGAWTVGRKDDGQGIPLMNHMAKRGWVCISSSYRLSPTATFPDHIIDCKQALVWIKEQIQEYGGNPDFVMVTGGSAGGHLSSLLALSAGHEAFQPGFEDKDTTVQGAVPFYGVYDFTDEEDHFPHDGLEEMLEDSIFKLDMNGNEQVFKEASPLFHISDKAPPFMVIQGTHDTLVPVEASRAFSKALRSKSKHKVAYVELDGAQHAFDVFPSLRSEYVKFGVEKFLAWTYSQYLKSV